MYIRWSAGASSFENSCRNRDVMLSGPGAFEGLMRNRSACTPSLETTISGIFSLTSGVFIGGMISSGFEKTLQYWSFSASAFLLSPLRLCPFTFSDGTETLSCLLLLRIQSGHFRWGSSYVKFYALSSYTLLCLIVGGVK